MTDYKEAEQEIILGKNSRITILNTIIDVLDMNHHFRQADYG